MSDDYREERTYTIELRLSASFPDDYEGEEDGYEWHARFDRVVRPRIARAVIEALMRDPGWKVTPTTRGESESERLELRVERVVTRE
ncbi:hypothetical protein [Sandaracinus amylolyticus]|uniref:Uncharacterized protein n=1 Tax=Sandaracinus amylolyticus TaxID=927083 RepID=A0A0F6W200_9BACT|nr:hypothetical protein [Sandaracinus amylolyticus]AKF05252.1 hypothetical protein DB32_002401 [Sandaracinus amylolyticus]